ncbi:MAG: AEC family transporter [Erysipelotrichales bacterium]|nr:AEC family transporter [Erysipelotrichales bacterium]
MISFQVQLLILMAIGYLIKKIGLMNDETRSGLSGILLYVILPANILNAFYQNIDFSAELVRNSIYAIVISAVVQFGTYYLGGFLAKGMNEKKKAPFRYGIFSTNAAFIGIPTLENLYGNFGTLYGAIFMIPYRLTVWTMGIGLFYKGQKRSIVKQLLHPCMIAVAVGFVLLITGFRLPEIIEKPMQYLSRCTTPMSMLVIGGILAGVDLRTIFTKDTLVFSLFRLLLVPGALYLLLSLIPMDPMIKGIAVIMTAMPSASMAAILAERYGYDYEYGARIVTASTVLSMITVPLFGFLL